MYTLSLLSLSKDSLYTLGLSMYNTLYLLALYKDYLIYCFVCLFMYTLSTLVLYKDCVETKDQKSYSFK